MVTGVRERSSIRSMTFQKNLLGLVVPEPCSSWCCAETPAAAMQIARATSRVAAVERGMASCVLGGSGDGLEKACERARGMSLDRRVSSFDGKPAGESGARAPAADVFRSISRRRFEADALFDRTFSVTGNARKSPRAKPPDVSRTPSLRRLAIFSTLLRAAPTKETREEEEATRTGLYTLVRARATDERPRWLRSASPRSSRCVCAPCASALASIAPASHAAAVFRGVRASRETKRWRGVARRAAFRGASETPRGPHRDLRRGATTERTD